MRTIVGNVIVGYCINVQVPDEDTRSKEQVIEDAYEAGDFAYCLDWHELEDVYEA